jgi:mono/diheme cytochrome c family protein
MLMKKIACPSCNVGLKVADDLEPDTRIKCPKCKTGFRVPGDDEPAPKAARGRKAPGSKNEDVRDGRRTPRKLRRKKPESSKAPMIVGLVIGLVVLLGGGGALAAVLLSSRKKADATAENKGPVTPGYTQTMTTPLGPTGPGPATTPTAPVSESAVAAGRRVYDQHGCAKCHALDGNVGTGGGPGGRGGRRKVDLSRVGGRWGHTVDWISNFIRNPKAQGSTLDMPAYEDKIPPQDLRALAEFLATLR